MQSIGVARYLLTVKRGGTVTIASVAQATGAHPTAVGQFLKMWAAAGWMNSRREGRRLLIYSITRAGRQGLANLVERHGGKA